MIVARNGHTATLLDDGTVLFTGGLGDVVFDASAEIYGPATRSSASIEPMTVPRAWHSATLLRDGTVLIAGDYAYESAASTELFDPAAQR